MAKQVTCINQIPLRVDNKKRFSLPLLLKGDNLEGLNFLNKIENIRGKIKLVYADPPYGTKQVFTITDVRKSTISRISNGRVAYDDNLIGHKYLDFLRNRLILVRDLMADDGLIYIHIDLKMGHYVKCLMDEIFGKNNFINDIARIKCNPKNFARKGFGNIRDMVLFYSKTKKYSWNSPKQNLGKNVNLDRFKSIDLMGRRYTTTPLHAPGETKNGATGKKWRGMKPPAGRHWRYSPKVLNELDESGLIEWSSTGNPRKIIFADEVSKNGTKMQDIWTYKDPQNPSYPTEKNYEMLKMIVESSSNRKEIILDPFCGSGTTLKAAEELDRYWIGIDSSPEAIKVCKLRLNSVEFIDLKSNNKSLPSKS